MHLVFHQSRPCRPPTSASNDPTSPPLVAGRRVHQALPDVQDEKGARQPDLGVYTSRRNMRMIGSCKTGQLVPLVPVDVASPNGGFNKTLWADWLRSHEPNDLLQFMISQDDGSEPNWYLHSPLVVWSACADRCSGRRSEQEASGTSRARPGTLLLSPDSFSSKALTLARLLLGQAITTTGKRLVRPCAGRQRRTRPAAAARPPSDLRCRRGRPPTTTMPTRMRTTVPDPSASFLTHLVRLPGATMEAATAATGGASTGEGGATAAIARAAAAATARLARGARRLLTLTMTCRAMTAAADGRTGRATVAAADRAAPCPTTASDGAAGAAPPAPAGAAAAARPPRGGTSPRPLAARHPAAAASAAAAGATASTAR